MATNPQSEPQLFDGSAGLKKYKRDWYLANRERILVKAAHRKQTRCRFVTAEQLEECRKDPRKAFTIAGNESVVCLECGRLVHLLGGPHLRHHELTHEEYREKWGYNRQNALASVRHTEKLSQAAHSAGGVSRMGGKQHPSAERIERLIEARRAAPKRLEYRLNVGDSKRRLARSDLWKRRDGKVITDFKIVELRLEGRTIDQIGQRLGMGRASVLDRLRRIGFLPSRGFVRSRPCLFQHGQAVSGEAAVELCSDYGLTKLELANRLGVHHVWLSRITTGRYVSRPLNIAFARAILQMRRTIAKERRHQAATSKGGRPHALSRSERDTLPNKYVALHQDLKALRAWILGRPGRAKMAELSEWLCSSARQEVITTLLFWPQFFRWIRERYTDKGFLTGDWRPSELALDFLADDYCVAFDTVRLLIRTRTSATKKSLETLLKEQGSASS